MVQVNTKRSLGYAVEGEWSGECEDTLAQRWPDFVDPSKRLVKEAPFLEALINRYGTRVLDAAMGIGCESVFLAKCGSQVTGNEISSRFRRIALARARLENAPMKVTAIDWRNLAKVFDPDSFDVVLLLGNSLCLMRELADRQETVTNLKTVCRRGGVVVVDQRNFDYIIREKERILAGYFRYHREVMYCGSKVVGYPADINVNRVRFAYEDTRSKRLLGHLDMHPFLERELVDIFGNEGFSLDASLSDFRPRSFEANPLDHKVL
jgi:SAM-dependent methyltransferase